MSDEQPLGPMRKPVDVDPLKETWIFPAAGLEGCSSARQDQADTEITLHGPMIKQNEKKIKT